MFKAKSSMKV